MIGFRREALGRDLERGRDTPTGIDIVDPRRQARGLLAADRQTAIGHEVRKRPRAVDGQVDGRTVGNVEKGRDEAALRLARLDVEGQAVVGGREGDVEADLARLVEALNVRLDGEIDRIVRQRERGIGRQPGPRSGNRLTENEFVDAERVDIGGDRGKREAAALFARRRGGLAGRQAFEDDLARRQLFDIDIGAHQRQRRPVHGEIARRQEHALGVRDSDAFDADIAGQGARKALNIDGERIGIDQILDLARDEVLGGRRSRTKQRCGDEKAGKGEEEAGEECHQKACPMPA